MFLDILERKNTFLGHKNKKFTRWKNCHFCKGVSYGFGSKLAAFPFFFLGNKGQDNVIYDILERKNAFLGYKNKKFKKWKNCHFSKGVLHGFGQKLAIFPSFFFLGNIGQENVFYDILQRKNVFLTYKNHKFKKSKNCNFFKGVSPWFWSKIGHFSIFFF